MTKEAYKIMMKNKRESRILNLGDEELIPLGKVTKIDGIAITIANKEITASFKVYATKDIFFRITRTLPYKEHVRIKKHWYGITVRVTTPYTHDDYFTENCEKLQELAAQNKYARKLLAAYLRYSK